MRRCGQTSWAVARHDNARGQSDTVVDSAVIESREGEEDVRGRTVAGVEEMNSTGSDGRVRGFGLRKRVGGPPVEWRAQKGSGHGCVQKNAVGRWNKGAQQKYKQCHAIYNSHSTSDDW